MHIRVNGTPAPQGSVNAWAIKKAGQYTGQVGMRSASGGHAEWRNAVALEVDKELAKAGLSVDDRPLFGPGVPCVYAVTFYLPRPKSHYGTGRNAGTLKPDAPAWPMTKDVDKLQRTVLDALQLAGVVDDDKQFVGTRGVWRVYADYLTPGADIWVDPAPAGIPALSGAEGAYWVYRSTGLPPLVDFATGDLLARGSANAD